MDYSTKAALGIKDSHLELDTAHFKDAIEDQGNQVIVQPRPVLSLTLPALRSINAQEWL